MCCPKGQWEIKWIGDIMTIVVSTTPGGYLSPGDGDGKRNGDLFEQVFCYTSMTLFSSHFSVTNTNWLQLLWTRFLTSCIPWLECTCLGFLNLWHLHFLKRKDYQLFNELWTIFAQVGSVGKSSRQWSGWIFGNLLECFSLLYKFVICYIHSLVCNGIHFIPSQTNVRLDFCDRENSIHRSGST